MIFGSDISNFKFRVPILKIKLRNPRSNQRIFKLFRPPPGDNPTRPNTYCSDTKLRSLAALTSNRPCLIVLCLCSWHKIPSFQGASQVLANFGSNGLYAPLPYAQE